MSQPSEGRFARTRRAYRALALVVLNALVIFLALNAIASGLEKPRTPPPLLETEMARLLPRVYPGRAPAEIAGILQETWLRPLEFDPYLLFKETAFHGRWVNVTEQGFRCSREQGPWPPDGRFTNVFVFGGSTTFGYGVADGETVPSFLQEALAGLEKPARVYNFARGFYYSTQERILFERLLTAGAVPDVAVFVDGLNDFLYPLDEPYDADRFGRLFATAVSEPKASDFVQALPIVRALRSRSEPSKPAPLVHGARTPAEIDRVIERFSASKKLLAGAAAASGVKAIFVWQPVPSYKYDLSCHVFAPLGLNEAEVCGPGYEAMARFVAKNPPGADFLWLADVQDGWKEPLYVDRIHYGPPLARRVAQEIARLSRERGLLR